MLARVGYDSMRALGVLLLVGVAFAPICRGQTEAGKFRVAAGIGGFNYSDIDFDGPSVETEEFVIGPSGNLRIGFLPADMVEVGLVLGVQNIDVETGGVDSDTTSWLVGPYIEANIPVGGEGAVVLAPGFGVAYSGADGDGFDLDGAEFLVSATLKYFIVENASLDFGIDFAYFIGEAKSRGIDVDVDGYSIGPRIGISIWP